MTPQHEYSEAYSDLIRITAFEHLFSILDGNDRDAAIDAARTWLSGLLKESYFTMSRAMRAVHKLDAEEWPEELE